MSTFRLKKIGGGSALRDGDTLEEFVAPPAYVRALYLFEVRAAIPRAPEARALYLGLGRSSIPRAPEARALYLFEVRTHVPRDVDARALYLFLYCSWTFVRTRTFGLPVLSFPLPEPFVRFRTMADIEAFSGESLFDQPFDIGTAGSLLDQPFDIVGPPARAVLEQLFDIVGKVGIVLDQPFDIVGPAASQFDQLFDIRSSVQNEVQVITANGVIVQYRLMVLGEWTAWIPGNANAAAVQAAIEALAGVNPGDVIVTGGPLA